MKALIFLGIIGVSFCLSVPTRSRSATSDPCSTSPCAKDATCEASPSGFAFCRCKSGFTGDAFVKCDEIMMPGNPSSAAGSDTTNPATMSSQSTTTMNSGHTTTSQRQYPPRFTLDYNPSSSTSDTNVQQQDLSRIPILGSTAASTSHQTTHQESYPFNQNRVNTPPQQTYLPSSTVVHETVVHTHNIQRYPSSNPHHQMHQSNNNNYMPISQSHHLLPSPANTNPIVTDPMGQYSNCRSIRGVIVCADNSVDDSPLPANNPSSFRPHPSTQQDSSIHHQNRPIESSINSHSPTNNNNLHNLHNPFSQMPAQFPHSGSSSSSSMECKSLCGINSVCRMVNRRPVCGCPVDSTGDPGVRCDPIKKTSETTSLGCQKHTECAPTQICADSKCIDPCAGGGLCGKNAECISFQHTQLCRCNVGLNGNPYKECLPF